MTTVVLLAIFAVVASQTQANQVISNMREAQESFCSAQTQMLDVLTSMENKITQLENTRAKARSVILLSETLSEAENKITQLENTSQAQAEENVLMSEALADAEEKILQLQNISQDQAQETYKLSEALAVAESKFAKFQNESEVRSSLNQTYSNLSLRLDQAGERIEMLEKNAGSCSMRYNGKCFWLEVRMSSPVKFEEAAQICKSQGATMANIYSKDHHVMMMGYLRMFTDINGKWMTAWLGMTYDVQVKTVLLSTGATAPYVKWGIGNPRKNNCCKMYLLAQTNNISTEQYMYTSSTSYARRGVFCEI